jgi:hypothetical protein
MLYIRFFPESAKSTDSSFHWNLIQLGSRGYRQEHLFVILGERSASRDVQTLPKPPHPRVSRTPVSFNGLNPSECQADFTYTMGVKTVRIPDTGKGVKSVAEDLVAVAKDRGMASRSDCRVRNQLSGHTWDLASGLLRRQGSDCKRERAIGRHRNVENRSLPNGEDQILPLTHEVCGGTEFHCGLIRPVRSSAENTD